MSEGIQRAAGSQLRQFTRSVTKNRFRGILTGLFTTATVQSSSATTVMTVSFVNAGLISLRESAGVMMGANVGTTITAWIIAGLAFRVQLYSISLVMLTFGVPMLFRVKGKLKYWGEFIVGFSILLLGLHFLQENLPDLTNNPILDWLKAFNTSSFFTRVFFVFIGALITILVQSSSAAIALTMTLCVKGWIPFDLAACMVLGENIGTTVTAELAALIGNVHAKRSARIHTLFNLIGVSWMIIALPVFLKIDQYLISNYVQSDSSSFMRDSMNYGLAAFHTLFNLANVLLFFFFVPFLIQLATITVPSKNEEDELLRLKFFAGGSRTPELALVELKKELAKFGSIVVRMHVFTDRYFNNFNDKERSVNLSKIQKYEGITNSIEEEIKSYCSYLSKEEITLQTSINLRKILSINSELEALGNLYAELSDILYQKSERKIWFTPNQRQHVLKVIEKTGILMNMLKEHLNAPRYKDVDIMQSLIQVDENQSFLDSLLASIKAGIHIEALDDMDDPVNEQGIIVYENILTQWHKINERCALVIKTIKE